MGLGYLRYAMGLACCFGAPSGLKSDITPCPSCANIGLMRCKKLNSLSVVQLGEQCLGFL
jgi:hypothetical protein